MVFFVSKIKCAGVNMLEIDRISKVFSYSLRSNMYYACVCVCVLYLLIFLKQNIKTCVGISKRRTLNRVYF